MKNLKNHFENRFIHTSPGIRTFILFLLRDSTVEKQWKESVNQGEVSRENSQEELVSQANSAIIAFGSKYDDRGVKVTLIIS